MGWSCSWISVRGKETDPILQVLGLRRPDLLERPDGAWAYDELPSGWLIVFSDKNPAPPNFDHRTIAEISLGCDVLLSIAEERSMCSSTTCWKNGTQVWSVAYDSDNDQLTSQGDPPSSFRAMTSEESELTDPFGVPLELGAELTGFRYDEGGLRALVTATDAPKKPWWKIW
jgi:hypothetical protein